MRLMWSVLSCVIVLVVANSATAATLQATYLFNDTLAAQEPTAPALMAVDPLGLNGFENAIVFGQNRRVYRWDGNRSPPNQQAGLSLDTTGVIPTNDYSVELVFEFLEGNNAWRRIVDVQARTSDHGFYVDPSNHLNVFPVGGDTTAWTNNVFHHIVLTNASTSTVKGYLNGVLEFTLSTSAMHINNPGDLLHFFLDNTAGSGQGEYSDGRIALIRVYDGVLTDSEVSQLAQNPFGRTPMSEPAGVFLFGVAVAGRDSWY